MRPSQPPHQTTLTPRWEGACSDARLLRDVRLSEVIPPKYHVLFDAAVYSQDRLLAPNRSVRYHLRYVVVH